MPFNTSYLETNITEVIKGNIDYIAISTDYDNQERSANIATALESGRAVPIVSRSGNIISISVTLNAITANNTQSLITNTPSDKKTFDVVDATGFSVGDRMEIFSSTGLITEQRKITNISTNTITLDRELLNLPVNNELFKNVNSNIYLINGGSIIANSGTAIYCFQYTFLKLNTFEKTLTFQIDVTGL
jgi:hypothetical protein